MDAKGRPIEPCTFTATHFLRCQVCKGGVFDDCDGSPFAPLDRIICPHCKAGSLRMFWIQVANPFREPLGIEKAQ